MIGECLPYESETVNELRVLLEPSTAVADQLRRRVSAFFDASSWTVSTNPKNPTIDPFVTAVVAGRLAKAIKSHRAVQGLAHQGLGHDALTVCRALLETSAAIAFILQQDSRHRAALYTAHALFNKRKMLTGWRNTPELRKFVTPENEKAVNAELATVVTELGDHVDYRSHWSGRGGLEQALNTLHGTTVYQILFRHASSIAHSTDIADYLFDVQEEERIGAEVQPSEKWTREALHAANVLLWLAAMATSTGLGLRFDVSDLRLAVIPDAT